MSITSEWIDGFVGILAEKGYAVGRSPVGSAFLATKRVHSLGPFLPCTDYIFIRDCSSGIAATDHERFHDQARAFTDGEFRLPRALRYHIPNTVSVGISERGFSEEAIGFAQKSTLRTPLVGGEKDSVYLFDIASRQLHSHGLEATPARYGARVVTTVNPTNRTYKLMSGIFKLLVAQRTGADEDV